MKLVVYKGAKTIRRDKRSESIILEIRERKSRGLIFGVFDLQYIPEGGWKELQQDMSDVVG